MRFLSLDHAKIIKSKILGSCVSLRSTFIQLQENKSLRIFLPLYHLFRYCFDMVKSRIQC